MTSEQSNTRVIGSQSSWIESDAIDQLKKTAQLKGIVWGVGLPDLHVGRGYPIGAAFLSTSWIYPHLVGNDIGCGMGLWKTDLKAHKIKMDKWCRQIDQLDEPWKGEIQEWLESYGLAPSLSDTALGTIGGGNHFAELQQVHSIENEPLFNRCFLDKKALYLLIHSGSRGKGEAVLQRHLQLHGSDPLREDSKEAARYLQEHDQALLWAKANRALIAYRFLSSLRAEGQNCLDIAHNLISQVDVDGKQAWLHRKGAAPADQGPVIIPGSRGDLSYLVHPKKASEKSGFSLAHGAGRKWNRTKAKGCLAKYQPRDFIKTQYGSTVICEDRDLMYEEAPQAYKNINRVIQDLVDADLIEVIATFQPVITYKIRRSAE